MDSPLRRWESASGFRPRRCGRSPGATSREAWIVGYSRRSSGQGSGAGSATEATHHCGGLLAAAGGAGTLDCTAANRRGDPAQAGSAHRTGDHTSAAGKPRSEAVAGKKCGAWRSWMRSTLPAWRRCWSCMKDRSRQSRPETRTFHPLTDEVVRQHLAGDSPSALIRFCRTRRAGFWRSVLTRRHGRRMPLHFSVLARNWMCPPP